MNFSDTTASFAFRMLNFLKDHNYIRLLVVIMFTFNTMFGLFADVWGLVEPQGQDQTWTTTFLDIELQVSVFIFPSLFFSDLYFDFI
jgi:hypothetical protein